MKKKITILLTVCFSTILFQHVSQQSTTLSKSLNTELVNVEALAQTETGPNSWLQPQTVRCKHELGGGWFESSVERICTFCAVPYSCTPVSCGVPF